MNTPFCIQIELTQGCNLRCKFCAVAHAYKPNRYKYMSLDTAHIIADRIKESKWNPRIEFAMHGEPLLNPNWSEIIAVISSANRKLHITLLTNGSVIAKMGLPEIADSFFSAGGSTLGIDMYKEHPVSSYIRKIITDNSYDLDYDIRYYPSDKNANPHARSKDKFIALISDITENTTGTYSKLSNHAGIAGELDFSVKDKPCVKPFREMGICWDGSVNICCNDFCGECKLGNIHKSSLPEIWDCDVINAYRRMLLDKGHLLRPCHGCDYTGYCLGLLPGQKGKLKLEPFSETDKKLIQQNLNPISAYSKEVIMRFKEYDSNHEHDI